MKRWIRTALTICVLSVSACNGDQATEMLETAEFEERQHNEAHAKQLYEDILRLYPSSKEAETARARLSRLNQQP
ncbi:tetratricopeptide repeat protein [Petrachloros mirabilis]